jgi:hypothetical protein
LWPEGERNGEEEDAAFEQEVEQCQNERFVTLARPRRERHARETLLRPVGARAVSWPRRVSRSPGQRAARRLAPGLGDARASMPVPHFPKRAAAGMLLMA